MNHQLHYDALMDRARSRALTGYVERHHVHPRCLGGSDEPSNLVRLTPEEHFVAHQLLVRMFPDSRSLLWAAVAMTNSTSNQARRNKLYGWLRRAFAERVGKANAGRKMTPEQRQRMGESRRGKPRGPFSASHRKKMSEAAKRYVKTPEHRAAMSAARIGKKKGPHSAEHRQKLSASIKAAMAGWDRASFKTPEYRARQSESMRHIWAQRKAAGKRLLPLYDLPVGG